MILALILGIVIVFIIFFLLYANALDIRDYVKYGDQKEIKKDMILGYLKNNKSITNDQIQELVNISDATVVRYMDELEKEGLVKQIGDVGRGVEYELKN